MSSKTKADRLAPHARLARGLKYSAVGPVDVTRGALGIGLNSAQSTASWLRNRYQRGRVAEQLGKDLAAAQEAFAEELAAAQEVVSNLPATIKQARRPKRRALLFVAGGAAVLGIGAVAFSIIRRSTQPEPSPLPPSVEVSPKP